MRMTLKGRSYDVTSENDLRNKIPYYAIKEDRIILYNTQRLPQINQLNSNSMLEKALAEISRKYIVDREKP